ncbi:unnamed protein product [Didymodactylos carnosus]|uniref:Deacetylase sirtuin-type domain-containing protein n=1 Tax=Didymodactylos carnosus TaxID=1234261 RepID=A0A814EVQ2_9BILA|nr:unnamed protein product [Didymodactylos carnosus]CAF3746126.1 unnamed protein product [Didymodactylos carnosus]
MLIEPLDLFVNTFVMSDKLTSDIPFWLKFCKSSDLLANNSKILEYSMVLADQYSSINELSQASTQQLKSYGFSNVDIVKLLKQAQFLENETRKTLQENHELPAISAKKRTAAATRIIETYLSDPDAKPLNPFGTKPKVSDALLSRISLKDRARAERPIVSYPYDDPDSFIKKDLETEPVSFDKIITLDHNGKLQTSKTLPFQYNGVLKPSSAKLNDLKSSADKRKSVFGVGRLQRISVKSRLGNVIEAPSFLSSRIITSANTTKSLIKKTINKAATLINPFIKRSIAEIATVNTNETNIDADDHSNLNDIPSLSTIDLRTTLKRQCYLVSNTTKEPSLLSRSITIAQIPPDKTNRTVTFVGNNKRQREDNDDNDNDDDENDGYIQTRQIQNNERRVEVLENNKLQPPTFSFDDYTQELMQTKSIVNALRGLQTDDTEEGEPVLKSFDLKGAADYMKNCKNIIVMSGAGISTSAGIPDFRSPGTGLYSQLEKYNLPFPEAVFHLEFFRTNPKPFFLLAKELYPEKFTPTPAHYFMRLLNEKKKLLRIFTQNIDSLERVAEIPADKIVEAHGTFFTAHCIDCQKEYSLEYVKDIIFKDEIPTCACGGIIKPDIVFFGESLPEKFHTLRMKDFPKADFLIIIGTSLMVAPFNRLILEVNKDCPRLLINMEPAGTKSINLYSSQTLMFDSPKNRRDVFHQGSCDDGTYELAKLLGWEDDFKELLKSVGVSPSGKKAEAIVTPTKERKTQTSAATNSPSETKASKASVKSSPQRTRSHSPTKKASTKVSSKNDNSPKDSRLNEAAKNADKLAHEMAKAAISDDVDQADDEKKNEKKKEL